MKNLKIRGKLFAAFALVITIFMVTIVGSFGALHSAKGEFTQFLGDAIALSNTTYEMHGDLEEISKNICNAILASSRSEAQIYLDEMEVPKQNLQKGIDYLKANVTDSEVQAKITELEQEITGIKSTQEAMISMSLMGDKSGACNIYFATYEPTLNECADIVLSFDDYADDYVNTEYGGLMQRLNVMMRLMAIFSVVALGLAVLIAMKLTKRFVQPIAEVTDAAKEMAKGNLNAVELLTYQSEDELGVLSDCMRFTMTTLSSYITEISNILAVMADGDLTRDDAGITDFRGDFASIKESLLHILQSFNSVLGDIKTAADQVECGSEQVAQGAQSLSQGAAEQAASTEELAASINEIDNKVAQAGEYAVTANQKTGEAGRLLNECDAQMEEMLSAMDDITRGSHEIGKIIKTIEDIAFQTNILSLNAAVEAARAGAAGKGFAVVADEVRNLANRSAEASKNTTELIENSIRTVNRGAELAKRTADNLKGVVEAASEVVRMVDNISNSTREQAESIDQISVGIDQISAVVQTNSATSEESAAASEELSSQAVMLKDLIGHFTLYDAGMTAATRSRTAARGQETTKQWEAGPELQENAESDISDADFNLDSKY